MAPNAIERFRKRKKDKKLKNKIKLPHHQKQQETNNVFIHLLEENTTKHNSCNVNAMAVRRLYLTILNQKANKLNIFDNIRVE